MIRRSQGYASDHHCRSRYREVSFPGSWCRCGWQGSCSPSAQAALCSDVLSEAAAVPGWHRGLCVIALLVAGLQALGHTVRLMPPAYVKPYVKRHKNDAADAEAICEAVTRPNMRFVPTKTPEQQSCLMLHRTRHLFIRQQTAIINSIRAHLAEFGIVAPVGRRGVEQLLKVVADANDTRLPEIARDCVAAQETQLLT